MGIAANQARLLSITARLADVEYQTEALTASKLRLATQSSQEATNYTNNLNDIVLNTELKVNPQTNGNYLLIQLKHQMKITQHIIQIIIMLWKKLKEHTKEIWLLGMQLKILLNMMH